MASVAEQLASNISFSAFRNATELKKRIWFTLLALLVYRLGTYLPLPGINIDTLIHVSIFNQVEVVNKLYVVINYLLSTTLSIKPNSFALSGVIKLSLSKASLISATDLPVCLE